MSSEDRSGEDRPGSAVWPRRKPRWRGWRSRTVEPTPEHQSFDEYAAARLWSFLCAQLTTALVGYLVFVLGDPWLGRYGSAGGATLASALPAMPMGAALAVAWSKRGGMRASLAALVFLAALEAGIALHALQGGEGPSLVLPAFVLVPLTFSPVLPRGWIFAAAALALSGPLALIALGQPTGAERFGLMLSMSIATATSLVTNLFAVRSQRKSFRLEHQLRTFADIDELTQLPRRRRVFELGRRVLQRAERHGQPFSVLYIDADHFKSVNDRFGHDAGDHALRLIAGEIQKGLRPNDVCGRFGGEEFVALLPATDEHDAARIAERLRKRIEERHQFDEVMLTISVGVAQHVHGEQIDRAIRRADAALLDAKDSGRNRVVIAPRHAEQDASANRDSTLVVAVPGSGRVPRFDWDGPASRAPARHEPYPHEWLAD